MNIEVPLISHSQMGCCGTAELQCSGERRGSAVGCHASGFHAVKNGHHTHPSDQQSPLRQRGETKHLHVTVGRVAHGSSGVAHSGADDSLSGTKLGLRKPKSCHSESSLLGRYVGLQKFSRPHPQARRREKV
ncbi:hypothetical protein E2C01_017024 [Portunus trituberculatus]|uniref:Uncharacterized protein n=1 Tax=Portunus trituberculatus TaxID=210409 RepID=A0A5B7DSP7_PORTR|nr:hypothetical protein [Portunus trituberculatus]